MSGKAYTCWLLTLVFLTSFKLMADEGEKQFMPREVSVVDLSEWRPSAGMKILNGPWIFFPNEFIEFSEIRSAGWSARRERAVTGSLPMIWHNLDNPQSPGQPLSSYGYGTYILPLRLPVHTKIGIQIPKIYNAFDAHLVSAEDDTVQFIVSRGVIGRTAEEHVCQEIGTTSSFMALSSENFLVIRVSNFQLRRGGIDKAPVLGDERLLVRKSNYKISLKMFIIGLIAAVALYNSFLYLNRPEDKSSIFLALFSFTVAIRILTSNDLVEFWFDRPSVGLNEWRNKLEYFTMSFGAAIAFTFFSSIYPRRFPKWLQPTVWLLALPCSLLALFTTSRVFTNELLFFQLTLLVISVITLSRVLLALFHRDEGWQLSLIGGIPLFLGIAVDILISYKNIDFPHIIQYSMVVFIMIQSQILGKTFSKAFRTAEKLSVDLQREVARQTEEIKAKTRNIAMILEHIQQGIFTIKDQQLGLDQERSKHLEDIFKNVDIRHTNAIDLLFSGSEVDRETQDMQRQILESCMNEQHLNFLVNQANLVREYCKDIHGHQRYLALDWVPVLRENDEIEKILVTVRDVTALRQLEQETIRHKERISMLSEMTELPVGKLGKFLNSASKLLEESLRLVEASPKIQMEILKILFINMHTIKGNARQLDLKKISLAAHEIENDYAVVRLKNSSWSQATMIAKLHSLQNLLDAYNEYYQKIYGKNDLQRFVDEYRQELMESTKNLHFWALSSQDPSIQDFAKSIHSLLFQLLFRSGNQLLQEMFQEVGRLARDLGKPVPQVQIDDIDFGISPEGEELLQNVFLHLLRNSMDHGIEPETERLAKGKSAMGLIKVHLQLLADRLEVTLADDGRGLAISKIIERHQQIGKLPIPSLSVEDAAQLIFQDGLSTTQVTTAISGRGVGMGAVRNYLVSAGGNILIKSTGPMTPEGFLSFAFVLIIPASFIISVLDDDRHRLVG